jgi:hypothetical protein
VSKSSIGHTKTSKLFPEANVHFRCVGNEPHGFAYITRGLDVEAMVAVVRKNVQNLKNRQETVQLCVGVAVYWPGFVSGRRVSFVGGKLLVLT